VPIAAYGNGHFRFSGMSHTGSLLILPSGIYGWRPQAIEDVKEADFAAVFAEAADISFLLLGAGKTMALAPEPIRRLFAAAKLPLETMDTGAAVRTYNVLLAEDRAPAAALIAVD
jgi:uncharacterized protein